MIVSKPRSTIISNSQIFDDFCAKNTKNSKTKLKEYKKIAEDLVGKHISTLSLKYRQSNTVDEFGVQSFNQKEWEKQREKFIDSALATKLGSGWVNHLYKEICSFIDEAVENAQLSSYVDFDKMSPYEFEEHCAQILSRNGWAAITTKRSGDQGIDVLARKGNISVVLQCKLYSSPVGNTAVQEALSGKTYCRANYGAVVTNTSFTRSARELALSTGIMLLRVDELKELDKLI